MSTLPAMTVTPLQAANAYRSVESGAGATDSGADSGSDFGSVLGQAVQGMVANGRAAETTAMSALSGGADLANTVLALSKADLALQTTLAVRDRVVQAYQDIIKMPM